MKAISVEINNRRKVFTIRELFNNEFPSLKLEFYAKPHTADGPHSDKLVVNNRLTIGDCRTVDHDGVLVIDPAMTTGELKRQLSDTFGLKGEIYQWNGSTWKMADSGKQSLETFSGSNGAVL